ncbi:GNAT family N-acetyltransferase [Pseudonocardia nantongensis]|uniref:GNAT family N-acetyltransferase n=1 Tax=Pseudonocardia nantongensis TaxID=1181885 RepID=UPI0039789938
MAEDHDVRTLTDPADRRAATDLFRASVHAGPIGDAVWERHGHAADEHWLGARTDDGELAGTAFSFPTRLTLPGGTRVPAAAVSAVGVRADRTRAGRLSALMRAQLTAAADRGDVAAVLRASETGIYERFGYGIAARGEHVRVGAHPRWRPEAPAGGTVRMLGPDEAVTVLPPLQERLAGARPGGMTRNERWWTRAVHPGGQEDEYRGFAVHRGPDGDDGFVQWGLRRGEPRTPGGGDVLEAQQLWAAGPDAVAGLWRFLTGIDLTSAVMSWFRPLDEHLDLMLVDPREVRVEGRGDDVWLRLLDVRGALAARSWGPADPVVLRVRDPLFDDRSGTWRIGPDGPAPAGAAAPELECDVAGLGTAFLGDRLPSVLVATGRWTEHVPGAAARADLLFGTGGPAPWCGTFF